VQVYGTQEYIGKALRGGITVLRAAIGEADVWVETCPKAWISTRRAHPAE